MRHILTAFLLILSLSAKAQYNACEDLRTLVAQLSPDEDKCFEKIREAHIRDEVNGFGDTTRYFGSLIWLDELEPGYIVYNSLLKNYKFEYVAFAGKDREQAEKVYQYWHDLVVSCLPPSSEWIHKSVDDPLLSFMWVKRFSAEQFMEAPHTYLRRFVGLEFLSPDYNPDGNYLIRISVYTH